MLTPALMRDRLWHPVVVLVSHLAAYVAHPLLTGATTHILLYSSFIDKWSLQKYYCNYC
ncbi:hypothetical protein Hanom_Chr11g00973061 [Helianthus anomalus]